MTDMTLKEAQEGKEYIIQQVETDDEELNSFLFSLGCYSGEKITVVTQKNQVALFLLKMEDIVSTINLLKLS